MLLFFPQEVNVSQGQLLRYAKGDPGTAIRQKGWNTLRAEVNVGRPRGQFIGEDGTGKWRTLVFFLNHMGGHRCRGL